MGGVGRAWESAFVTCHHSLPCWLRGILELNRGSCVQGGKMEKIEVMGYWVQGYVCLSGQCAFLFVPVFRSLAAPLSPPIPPSFSSPLYFSLIHTDVPRICTPVILSPLFSLICLLQPSPTISFKILLSFLNLLSWVHFY